MRSSLSLLMVAAVAAMASAGRLTEKPVSGLCTNQPQYAGYYDIDPSTDKEFFYWWFESQSDSSSDPVVMWLTGGPGCGSELALVTENGPCKIQPDGSMKVNPYSWNAKANVIYVDDIPGAGFTRSSNAGLDHNETEVARDLYEFLQDFLEAHPQLQGNPVFITAESYGGHYSTALSGHIFDMNQAGERPYIPLAGVAIGNGLVDPKPQYEAYPHFVWEYATEKLGHPVVSQSQHDSMVEASPKCASMIDTCQTDTSECPDALNFCNNAMWGPYLEQGLNPYNFRLPCEIPGLCYNFSSVLSFFNNPATQNELGVRDAPQVYELCNDTVNGILAAEDWMKSFADQVPKQLANGTRFLVYAGDLDFSVNWWGGANWTTAMQWPGQQQFSEAPLAPWVAKSTGAPAGEHRFYQDFHFMRVFNAGHMVPSDQPAVALEMIQRFIDNSL